MSTPPYFNVESNTNYRFTVAVSIDAIIKQLLKEIFFDKSDEWLETYTNDLLVVLKSDFAGLYSILDNPAKSGLYSILDSYAPTYHFRPTIEAELIYLLMSLNDIIKTETAKLNGYNVNSNWSGNGEEIIKRGDDALERIKKIALSDTDKEYIIDYINKGDYTLKEHISQKINYKTLESNKSSEYSKQPTYRPVTIANFSQESEYLGHNRGNNNKYGGRRRSKRSHRKTRKGKSRKHRSKGRGKSRKH